MRGAKKEVLRLLTTFIEKAAPPEAPKQSIAQNFLPPMLDPILGDYHVRRRQRKAVAVLYVLVGFRFGSDCLVLAS